MWKKINDFINSSPKNRVLYPITLIISVMFLAFNMISVARSAIINKQSVNKLMSSYLNVVSEQSDSVVSENEIVLRQVASEEFVKDYLNGLSKGNEVLSDAEMGRKLAHFSSLSSQATLCWIASDSTGHYVLSDSTGRNLDIPSQPWYSAILINPAEQYVWISAPDEGMNASNIITLVTAIKDNGNVIGYVGLEIHERELNACINRDFGASGVYSAVIASNGEYILKDKSEKFDTIFAERNLRSIVDKSKRSGNSIVSDEYSLGFSGKIIEQYVTSGETGWISIILCDTSASGLNYSEIALQELVVVLCFCFLVVLLITSRIKNEFERLDNIFDNFKRLADNKELVIPKEYVEETGAYAEVNASMKKLSESIKASQKELYQLKNYDILTGLPSINVLREQATELARKCDKDNSRFALVFIDIDHFGWVNENHGHTIGDECIKQFSITLSKAIEQYGVPARLIGDEFIFLIEFRENVDFVTRTIARLKKEFKKPLKVCGEDFYIKFSTGISIYPDDERNFDLLLRYGNTALNQAKERECGKTQFFTEKLLNITRTRNDISNKLSGALARGEITLAYQPIISTLSKDIHGFEVLVRWQNKDLGSVPPSEFIPVAEESGSIIPIGTWIFENACRFHKQLCEEYKKDMVCSINVSPQQLLQPDFMDNVDRVLKITKIRPSLLQIEITETVMIEIFETANDVLEKIHDLGIGIALDDFGTGYSSLSYLKSFPISCLKIDKCFVDEVYNNKRDYAITDSIIDLVHNLDISTVAEGVETAGQWTSLTSMTCDYIQGYLVSKPMTDTQALDFVRKYDQFHKPEL